MVHNTAVNSYQKAQIYDEINPNQLILMLYEGAIKRVNLAKEGLKKDDPKQRGENLGKAIAIISELNACLDQDVDAEEIVFLRSLYAAMLAELPKVNVTKDILTLERAEKYLTELKRIWETSVMNRPSAENATQAQKKTKTSATALNGNEPAMMYGSANSSQSMGSIAI